MGFFNDDRLAGQLKSSVGSELGFGTAIGSANSNFGWSSLGKPARLRLSRLRLCAPPSLLQPYCMCAFMAHASSLVPAETCLQPASNLLKILFFEETSYLERAERPNVTKREYPGRDAHFALRSKLRMPGRKFLAGPHGLTENSIRTGPSEV
jgi:hypothetical protein